MLTKQQKRIRKPLSYYLGTVCITLSLLGFLFVFYPIFRMYVFPPSLVSASDSSEFAISIPRIRARAPVIKNVDPYDAQEYKSALKKGVAHASTSSLPDTNGSVFLFAHSSGYPWEVTHYNTIFLRLSELEKHDVIEITYDGKTYEYKVSGKKEVWPQDVSYLLSTQKHKLILQTCTPIGTSLKRLLVFADRN